jgi:hypothetical protein
MYTLFARKKPCSLVSVPYRQVPYSSARAVVSFPVSWSGPGSARFQGISEWSAGNANQYVKEYFFRLAKESMVNEERREGIE